MAKSRARRNVIIVVVLFGLVGALIVLAGSLSGPPVIGPEPPEISRIRLSKAENGYFALMDALGSLPKCPASLSIDPDFERGPKAELLDVHRNEEDPEIDETIERTRPGVEAARRGLTMPHLLAPIDWKTFRRDPDSATQGLYRITGLFDRIFLVGVQDARTVANEERAVETVLDSYRLLWRCVDEMGLRLWAPPHMFSRSSLVLQCPEGFQQRLLSALKGWRAQWQPSAHWLDNALRIFEARRSSVHALYGLGNPQHLIFLGSEYLRSARARPLLARSHDTLLKVSGYTKFEYFEWAEANPELAEVADFGLFGFRLDDICEANSAYLLGLDGMILVLIIEQYRRDHGAYPDALDLLIPAYVPAMPLDPFTNKPFGYRKEGASYRLYGFGYDGLDNGGERYHSSDFLIHLPIEDSKATP